MLYAQVFLSRHSSALSAYNHFQRALMRRYLRRGGTLEEWCARFAPAFRARYGWMLGLDD
jgi:hypothetical protein